MQVKYELKMALHIQNTFWVTAVGLLLIPPNFFLFSLNERIKFDFFFLV